MSVVDFREQLVASVRERLARSMFNEWNRRGNWPSPPWDSASNELRRDWFCMADIAINMIALEPASSRATTPEEKP